MFEIADGARHKISAADALARGAGVTLSPSVALRPAVQDGVFPTVAMAVGPGEIAYLAQLREVFEGVGVAPAMLVPRFGATWLPPEALALIEASGADPWRVVADTDAVLAELAGEARAGRARGRTAGREGRGARRTDGASPRPRARSTRACRRWSSRRAARWTTSSPGCTRG